MLPVSVEESSCTVSNKTQNLSHLKHLNYILSTLRLVGLLPFHLSVSKHEYYFKWKWNSWATLYTTLVNAAILIGILWVALTSFQQSSKSSWVEEIFSSNKSSMERVAVKVYPSFSIVMAVMYIATAVSNTISVLQLIEKWQNFEKIFSRIFCKPQSVVFSNTFRTILLGGIFGTAAVTASTIPIRTQLEKSYCVKGNALYDDIDDDQHFCKIRSLVPVLNVIYALCEDLKTILLIRMTLDGFIQVKTHIVEWCESGSPNKNVTLKEIREWKKLILLLREQGKATSNAIAVQNIINSFILLVFLCLSLFLTILLIRGTLSDASRYTTYAAIALTGLGTARLAGKARLAEKIVHEEKSLANYLRLLEITDKTDIMARLEVSNLVSVMDKAPTQLELYKLFVINYSLLSKMVSTILTYLVILLQFNDL